MTFRLPKADRDLIEQAARIDRRDPTDWVWFVASEAAGKTVRNAAAPPPATAQAHA